MQGVLRGKGSTRNGGFSIVSDVLRLVHIVNWDKRDKCREWRMGEMLLTHYRCAGDTQLSRSTSCVGRMK